MHTREGVRMTVIKDSLQRKGGSRGNEDEVKITRGVGVKRMYKQKGQKAGAETKDGRAGCR